MSDDSHYTRFTAFRPRNVDPSLPQYAPERDFSQVTLWLAKLQSMIRSGDAEFWVRTLYNIDPGDAEDLGDQLGKAYLTIVEFLEDAAGADIVGTRYGTKASEASETPINSASLSSFEASLGTLLSGRHLEPAMLVLLAMLGVVSLNGLFFTVRQDRSLGRVGPMTFDEMWPLLAHSSVAVLSGVPDEVEAKRVLQNAVRYGKAAGLSDSFIESFVVKELAKD